MSSIYTTGWIICGNSFDLWTFDRGQFRSMHDHSLALSLVFCDSLSLTTACQRASYPCIVGEQVVIYEASWPQACLFHLCSFTLVTATSTCLRPTGRWSSSEMYSRWVWHRSCNPTVRRHRWVMSYRVDDDFALISLRLFNWRIEKKTRSSSNDNKKSNSNNQEIKEQNAELSQRNRAMIHVTQCSLLLLHDGQINSQISR